MENLTCWVCGKPATAAMQKHSGIYGDYDTLKSKKIQKISKFRRCYCENCFEEYIKRISSDNEKYLRLKRERMIETALYKLEAAGTDMYEYKEAIDAVIEYNKNNPDKFDSSAEVIAAIELIKNHIRIKPQYKVDKYQVDFLLPDEKIVLEIDGEAHRLHRAKDSVRDEVIRYQLKGYQVIHIPAKDLYEKPNALIKGIDAVLDYRYNYDKNWIPK